MRKFVTGVVLGILLSVTLWYVCQRDPAQIRKLRRETAQLEVVAKRAQVEIDVIRLQQVLASAKRPVVVPPPGVTVMPILPGGG